MFMQKSIDIYTLFYILTCLITVENLDIKLQFFFIIKHCELAQS